MNSFALARIGALAVALIVPAALPALAQPSQSYDGQWVIDVPTSPEDMRRNDDVCEGFRVPVSVSNGQVSGSIVPVASGSGIEIEGGTGPGSAPVTGTVNEDGTVSAGWENYHVSGKLTGSTGELMVQTECGTKAATAQRVITP